MRLSSDPAPNALNTKIPANPNFKNGAGLREISAEEIRAKIPRKNNTLLHRFDRKIGRSFEVTVSIDISISTSKVWGFLLIHPEAGSH